MTTKEIQEKTNLLIPSNHFPAFYDSNLVENRVLRVGDERRKSSRLLQPKPPTVLPVNHETSSLIAQSFHASHLHVALHLLTNVFNSSRWKSLNMHLECNYGADIT
ncbi:hypothetical protein AVEN_268678-1 [Araneus ventricosus]|uniref:Uncharacterized protein n=1 Tax=Araneus ventricosus TaxID=182803 RepID=A0A4Y2UXQ0_ARAVE|nr:hypothetical protein AVEN_268678-1 [Araneus ventricosus]